MSIFVNSDISFSPIMPANSFRESVNLEAKFQQAFENLDINRIIDLLSNGANPHQKIKLTKALVENFLKKISEEHFKRKDGIQLLLSLEKENLLSITDDEALIQKVLLIQQELKNEEPVSDKVLKDVVTQLEICCVVKDIENERIEHSPIFLAMNLKNIPLVDKLIQSGVDILDPKCLDLEISAQMKLDYLLEHLNELVRINDSIPLTEFNDPALSVNEKIEKIEEFLGYKNVRIIFRNHTSLYELSDLEDLEDKDIEFIDFLLEKGLPIERFIDISFFSFEDLIHVENPSLILDFLEKKGFDLQHCLNEKERDDEIRFCSIIEDLLYQKNERDISPLILELIKRNPTYFEENYDEAFQFFLVDHAKKIKSLSEPVQEAVRAALSKA